MTDAERIAVRREKLTIARRYLSTARKDLEAAALFRGFKPAIERRFLLLAGRHVERAMVLRAEAHQLKATTSQLERDLRASVRRAQLDSIALLKDPPLPLPMARAANEGR